jgi:hypothetical protein
MCAVERISGSLEQTRAVQKRPPPAATVQDRFHSGGDILNRSHQRSNVEKTRVICDQHHRACRQLADRRARVEVDQARPAQEVVQQRERTTHDALQEPRATRDIDTLRWHQLQERKRTVAERSDGEVKRQNREQRT